MIRISNLFYESGIGEICATKLGLFLSVKAFISEGVGVPQCLWHWELAPSVLQAHTATSAPILVTSFSEETLYIFQKNDPKLHLSLQHCFIVEERVLPAGPENIWHSFILQYSTF